MKKIVFLTGTRADFGKIKSLIQILEKSESFEVFVFVTGMHLMHQYGYTLIEIERCNFSNIHTFENHTHETTMDLTLAKTIQGFSEYLSKINPDMIVVHGDRVEALAGAVTGSLNNVLVAHIEGGEVSGTIDELIRHSTSKMSHLHLVSNDLAKKRLIQMGELEDSVFVIGSPDLDVMFSDELPSLQNVKEYYNIPFQSYAVAMFHPITTEFENIKQYAASFVNSLLDSNHNYIVVFPNNDLGSQAILSEYEKLKSNSRFRIFPSLRFEYFLILLKNAQFIIGNSSAGIREAPYYGVPTINVGTRQKNRASNNEIINVNYHDIDQAFDKVKNKIKNNTKPDFGNGNSNNLFLNLLLDEKVWKLDHQKQFRDF